MDHPNGPPDVPGPREPRDAHIERRVHPRPRARFAERIPDILATGFALLQIAFVLACCVMLLFMLGIIVTWWLGQR